MRLSCGDLDREGVTDGSVVYATVEDAVNRVR
jgi:hypothetical protein